MNAPMMASVASVPFSSSDSNQRSRIGRAAPVRISIASPIARAMIGKETGDVVEVNTPGGVKAYEIVKVEWV